tara:strand:+ start:398 stop:529 length:132 start_codon:yes stop_codon:yes gene_type:complete
VDPERVERTYDRRHRRGRTMEEKDRGSEKYIFIRNSVLGLLKN